MKKARPAPTPRPKGDAPSAEADLSRVMASARAMLWHATVREGGEDFVWDIRLFNEEAGARLWPVAVGPGQSYSDAWRHARPSEVRVRLDATSTDAIRAGVPDYSQEFPLLLADGSTRWLAEDVRIEPRGPGCWHLVGVCTDITERKAAEQALAAAADHDRRIAEAWHRSMLHQVAPGAFPGLALQTFYMAALEESLVGGDFFDSCALDERRVALAVGDVAGKGLAAAARTAEVKYALRAFLHAFPDPGEALGHLNDLICSTQPPLGSEEATLVVLSFAVVDRATGEAELACAGGEPPLILRASGAAEPAPVGGRILGVAGGGDYRTQRLLLGPGDVLLMATDGLTEARRGHAFLGLDGVAALAQAVGATAPLDHIGRAVLDGARAYTGAPLRDDVCLLLARRDSEAPIHPLSPPGSGAGGRSQA